ncbi:MAG TPA: thioredoxin domain-containing protein, partial [Chondromyces sp.]|nr:thioredoxin domain-containing protein [Chondromyces sp.]
MSTNKKTNRLIAEKSPYLLQHAYNPVDWYPWGDEAFDKAKKENKPIFLSIGYSTCHWCHVMERESFENEEVAKLLNDHYIAIKVDREERPDIDSIYMNVCQMMNEGHGGWPLTIIMTPDQVPFYAGTYFPKNSHYGRPGMTEMLPQLARVYHEESHKITETTEQVMNALQHTHQTDREEIKEEVLHEAFAQLKGQFDGIHGGFGQAPKFPIPHQLMFLLRYHQLTGNELALQMVTKTLDSMASGGIYDHVGYGFARYSVDEMWLIPHFEKMLYDNALLLHVYAEAYQLTKAERYKRICYEIIEFVQREMTNEQGGFLSAVDADSEGEEGKFYVWTKEEVIRVLGEEDGEVFCSVYDITEEGNFEGENIPNLIRSDIGQWEIYFGMELDELNDLLEHARRKLFHERDKRVHPHVDDKVLTAWNGLMIAALAKAGAVFEDATILQSARRSVQFIEKNLWKKEALFARWREGEEKFFGYLDD